MRRPVNQVGQGDSISEWYAAIPFVTKILVTSTVFLAGIVSFGLVQPVDIVMDWGMIIKRFQVWRLFTSFVFAGTFSFNFLMHIFVLYENCKRYEANPFNTGGGGSSADFLFMVVCGMILLSAVGFFMEIQILSISLMYMIMYVWSRREPEAVINFYGFKFQGLYLPWIYIAFNMLMGSSITMPLIGVGTGHIFFFLVEVLPASYGFDVVKTPRFCLDLVSYATGVSMYGGTSGAPTRGFGNMGAGHQWGHGRTLGAN